MFVSTQVAALERHTQGSERLLRDEEVAVLKDGLCPGDKAEKDMKGHSWESRLEELELRVRMCFFSSVGKVRLGHLLLGSRSIQSNEADLKKKLSLDKKLAVVEAHGDSAGTIPPPSIREAPGSLIVTTTTPNESKKWAEGSSCLARCPEDNTWYRAEVVAQDSNYVHVTFVDSNRSASVGFKDIVASVGDLSEDQACFVDMVALALADSVKEFEKNLEVTRSTVVNQMVGAETDIEGNRGNPFSINKVEAALDDSILEGAMSMTGKTLEPKGFDPKAGLDCVARWSEDQVWYRAQVAEVRPSGEVLVVFTDYGNSDLVEEGGILAGVEEVPSGEELDLHLITKAEVPLSQDENEGVKRTILEGEVVEDSFGNTGKLEQAEETDKIVVVKKTEELSLQEKSGLADEVAVHSLLSEQLPELKVGDFCIARFSEDDVWYNAQVFEFINCKL